MKKLIALLAVMAFPLISFGQSSAADATPKILTKTVADADTPERISSVQNTLFTKAIFIGKKAARTDNTGNVYIGPTATNGAQPYEVTPADIVFISTDNKAIKLDLYDFYLDVATADDGVVVIYW